MAIMTFEQAVAVQRRRGQAGKPFFAKAVKRWMQRAERSADQLAKLGTVCFTPLNYRRNVKLFGTNHDVESEIRIACGSYAELKSEPIAPTE